MTSPGLKRPLDFAPELSSATRGAAGPNSSGLTDDLSINGITSSNQHRQHSDISPNGTKRRCTSSTLSPRARFDHHHLSGGVGGPQSTSGPSTPITSPFNDLSSCLGSINDDITVMLSEEIQRASQGSSIFRASYDSNDKDSGRSSSPNTMIPVPRSNSTSTTTSSPSPYASNSNIKSETSPNSSNASTQLQQQALFTVQQVHTICERAVREREQKIRHEYDRILARKLAQQYDIAEKVNYIKSLEGSRMMPTSVTPMMPTSGSINDLAAAYSQMQRSVAAADNASALDMASASSLPELVSFANNLMSKGVNHVTTPMSHQCTVDIQQQVALASAFHAFKQNTPMSSLAPVFGGNIPPGPVLLVSNIDEQLAKPEALFTLFGVFGDVIRVKILFNKKDNALIQMADASQAQVAQGYLDKQKVFGKMIRVTRSKHQLVQMPREGNQPDVGLTKDFTNSPLHRFKIPGSRNYQNIYPPSSTLHISNIPADIDEEQIHRAFMENCGFEFLSFKFFPKDRKMALVRFNSVEHAAIALIKMHNFQISKENNLRVSFSKSVIQQIHV